MKVTKLFISIFFFLILICSSFANVNNSSVDYIKNLFNKIVVVSDAKTSDRVKKESIMELFAENIDFDYMAKMSLGIYRGDVTDYYKGDFNGFIKLFKNFFLYSKIVNFVVTSSDKMQVLFDKNAYSLSDKDSQVHVVIKLLIDGTTFDSKFNVRSEGKLKKVNNIILDNVDLILAYREEFSSAIEENGVSAFIKELEGRTLTLKEKFNKS